MSDLTIICPNCQSEIPLSDAVSHRLRDQLSAEFGAKLESQQRTFAEREKQLRDKAAQLEAAQLSLDTELAKRLAAEKLKLMSAAREQVQIQLSAEMQDLRNQLAERDQKLNQAQQAELGLRKQQRQLESQKQALELEVTRKIDQERAAIRDEATKAAADAERLKLAEKEKIIGDLQRELGNLQQKAEQGSVQLQGEVLELDLETRLAAQFPYDLIEAVAKGQRGADVIQRVMTTAGQTCGSILWEAKRAKHWTKDWLPKLKEDQRAAKADLAVLVSQMLPPDCGGFGQFDGVWVCDYGCVLPLAVALRQGLTSVAAACHAETGKQTKMEQLYAYLAGAEFRQRIEGVVEAFKTLREDLEAEKRALQKHWARREKQLEQAISHTAIIYGGVQGIVGQNCLPEIKILQLEAPDPNIG